MGGAGLTFWRSVDSVAPAGLASASLRREAHVDNGGSDRPYDQLVRDLEACVKDLEEGRLPLERAIERFKEGIELAKLAEKRLQDAEGQVNLLLTAESGAQVEQPFPAAAAEAPRGPRLSTSAPAARPGPAARPPTGSPPGSDDDVPF
jgi:exodeoxyribonuclease VII small subunit